MLTIGAFVRVTRDALGEEPLVEGMVGKVVADHFFRVDPAREALVLMAGSRTPVVVPLEAVEIITADDYGDDAAAAKDLWRRRKQLWRMRHGSLPQREPRPAPAPCGEPEREKAAPGLNEQEIARRAKAVTEAELRAISSPALLSVLTEWALGGLDYLADALPGFDRMSFAKVRRIRAEHLEQWLWDGVRVYLAMRSFRTDLPPLMVEASRDRVRALFERIDTGNPAQRLAAFCGDVGAVWNALLLFTQDRVVEAHATFAKRLRDKKAVVEKLAQFCMQLEIVGFQAAYCADAASHPAPVH